MQKLFGSDLAKDIIRVTDGVLDCAACAENLDDKRLVTAVVYGQPVVLCDLECLDMLRANWQPLVR